MTQKYGAVVQRNCDDIRILARTKEEARYLLNVYDRLCEERGLTVKRNSGYRPVPISGKDGLDFLGYVFTRKNIRVRKSIKTKFARGIDRVKSGKRRKELAISYKGWCMHGHGKNLYRKVMGFKDKGIETEPITRDGKKFFDVPEVSIAEILNVPMDVLDYESCIRTRDLQDRTKVNNDRYVVSIRLREGKKCKFITNARDIKETLDKCAEAVAEGKEIFPVENVAVVRKNLGGNKTTYRFIDL